MDDMGTGARPARDTAAECHMRAAADRLRASEMDTLNGRRKFEDSADSWDERGALLGRLEASFDKRERLDAASKTLAIARMNGAAAQAPPHPTMASRDRCRSDNQQEPLS